MHGRNSITHLAASVGAFTSQLSKALGVITMAVAYWEWGYRRIPHLLPLALEALEYRLKKGDGTSGRVPDVQEAE
jgi:hypothetical protein